MTKTTDDILGHGSYDGNGDSSHPQTKFNINNKGLGAHGKSGNMSMVIV